MATRKKHAEYSKIMELWVATDLKVQVLVFFHDNPGILDTMEGLARRLGVDVAQLRKELQGHIALGLLKEHKADGLKVLVFDRKREGQVQQAIEAHFDALASRAGAQ